MSHANKKILLKNKEKRSPVESLNTGSDLDRLIEKFLHPVFKFAASSEYLELIGNLLYTTIKSEMPGTTNPWELGEMVMAKLLSVRDHLSAIDDDKKVSLPQFDEIDLARIKEFKNEFEEIIRVFDYILRSVENQALLGSKIRDTAIRVLEELKKTGYFDQPQLRSLVPGDFVVFIQGVLLNYLSRAARTLKGETQILKREVEAFRPYIGLKKERRYSFKVFDIEKILAKNIELFEPVFSERNIDIDYKRRGTLTAEISRTDIERIIGHLFINAVNYSYEGKHRFVNVRVRELQPQNQVEISVENLGVPIKKEEIESESIFKFGYRGELAYKTYRDGIGGGLADVKDVILAHGGEIAITSKPKKDDGNPPQYEVPYLTKVTIKIPKKKKEE